MLAPGRKNVDDPFSIRLDYESDRNLIDYDDVHAIDDKQNILMDLANYDPLDYQPD